MAFITVLLIELFRFVKFLKELERTKLLVEKLSFPKFYFILVKNSAEFIEEMSFVSLSWMLSCVAALQTL